MYFLTLYFIRHIDIKAKRRTTSFRLQLIAVKSKSDRNASFKVIFFRKIFSGIFGDMECLG